jgi:toxin ParE1/3/4
MTQVVFLQEAEQELNEAIAFYEQKSSGLGLDFLGEVQETIRYIQNFPEGSERQKDGTRRHLIKRFPFILVYLIRKNTIWIVAVAHCKRRPNYWRIRMNS